MPANSGLPYNIRSNRDLNNDGQTNDRPIGITPNSGTPGSVFNLDARYSRFVELTQRFRLEIFAEAKNLLNNENVRSVNSVVTTDAAGNPANAIPASFPLTNTYESRQVQIGAKVTF